MQIFARRFTLLLSLLAAATAASAFAQDKEPPFEVFGGYSYLHESGNSFNGWTGTFVAEVHKGFGFAADFDGHYRSATEGGDKISEHGHGFTFGPHYAFHNESRFTPIVFALFGGAHASVSAAGRSISENGFAMNIGGGLDVRWTEAISVRLIQVDASYTRFDGRGSTAPRISAGLVFHFGKK
jgi:hypothetical protein